MSILYFVNFLIDDIKKKKNHCPILRRIYAIMGGVYSGEMACSRQMIGQGTPPPPPDARLLSMIKAITLEIGPIDQLLQLNFGSYKTNLPIYYK